MRLSCNKLSIPKIRSERDIQQTNPGGCWLQGPIPRWRTDPFGLVVAATFPQVRNASLLKSLNEGYSMAFCPTIFFCAVSEATLITRTRVLQPRNFCKERGHPGDCPPLHHRGKSKLVSA